MDNLAPPVVQGLTGEYKPDEKLIKITWWANPNVPDVAAYWVCPELPGLRYQLAHSAPVNRTVYYWPFSDTSQNSAIVAVAAMDYSGHIGPWLTYPVSVQPTIGYSNSGYASGLNNSRKLVYDAPNNHLKTLYTDNNTIYYRLSYDEGRTWPVVESLAPGIYPGLTVDKNKELHMVGINRNPPFDPGDPVTDPYYYYPGEYTWQIVYKRTANGIWEGTTYILDSLKQNNNNGSIEYSAPCIAVTSEDTVHIAVARTSYEQINGFWYWRWKLLYTNFPKNDVRINQWMVADSATEPAGYPPPGYCPFNASDPTIVVDKNDDINLAWGRYANIYYRFRKDSQWQSKTNISGIGIWWHPNINANNSEITVVWSGNPILQPGSQIRCRRRFIPNGKWGNIERLDTGDNMSVYPVTLNNNFLWAEEVTPGNYEIFRTWLDLIGWHTPENLTNDPIRSILPQMAYNANADRLYWMFTARDTVPYWIRFDKKNLSGIPLYGFALGADSLSSATIERTGTIDYGGEYKRMDISNARLSYDIPGLDPNRDYELSWIWYHEHNGPVQLKLALDNNYEYTWTIPPRQRIMRRIPIPAALYADSSLGIKILKINNGPAFLSGFAIYDVTEKNGGGPQGQDRELSDRFELKVYPNPVKGTLTIQYGLSPGQKAADLKIYDVTGRLVRAYNNLVNNSLITNQIQWRGDDALGRRLSDGIYFIQLTSGDKTKTEKVIMVR